MRYSRDRAISPPTSTPTVRSVGRGVLSAWPAGWAGRGARGCETSPPHGPRSSDAAAHFMRGRAGDCPGPRQEGNAGGGPPTHRLQPWQAQYWAPHTQKRSDTHRPRGRPANDDPTHSAKGRTGDCPGPRRETNEGRNVTQGGGGQRPKIDFGCLKWASPFWTLIVILSFEFVPRVGLGASCEAPHPLLCLGTALRPGTGSVPQVSGAVYGPRCRGPHPPSLLPPPKPHHFQE